MKDQTEEMLVYACPDADAEGGMDFRLVRPSDTWRMNDEDIKLGEVSVTYSIPGTLSRAELVNKAVVTLREKQQSARAYAEKRCIELESKIDKLLMLTHVEDNNVEDNIVDITGERGREVEDA